MKKERNLFESYQLNILLKHTPKDNEHAVELRDNIYELKLAIMELNRPVDFSMLLVIFAFALTCLIRGMDGFLGKTEYPLWECILVITVGVIVLCIFIVECYKRAKLENGFRKEGIKKALELYHIIYGADTPLDLNNITWNEEDDTEE